MIITKNFVLNITSEKLEGHFNGTPFEARIVGAKLTWITKPTTKKLQKIIKQLALYDHDLETFDDSKSSDGYASKKWIKGVFNDSEVQVQILELADEPGTFEIGEYPKLMQWSDAMEIVCSAGYERGAGGLLRKKI